MAANAELKPASSAVYAPHKEERRNDDQQADGRIEEGTHERG